MKKSLIISLVIALILILILGFKFISLSKDKQSSDFENKFLEIDDKPSNIENKPLEQESESQTNEPNKNAISSGCQGTGIVNLTSPPVPIEQIGFIQPMGLMITSHVTPTDHQYYSPKNFRMSSEITLNDLTDVLAPADGIITEIGRMPDFFAVKNSAFKDYRIIMHYTCDLYTIFIHVYQLSPEIEEQLKDLAPGNSKQVSIPVKSGQKIGKANVLDFSLHNNKEILAGFIVPEHYKREPWKIHTVDPFDYFVEPVKSQLLEKSLRETEPFGGKIDHDIDGKLIGNWFVENTKGYQGIKEPQYWETHVSFSPDALDPTYFLISLGDFKGNAKQFGSKSNSPNPKDVDLNSEKIKYELVDFEYLDDKGAHWDRVSLINGIKAISSNQNIYGVVLVELIENRKLKLEIFPDKKASEISDFTDKAMIYER